LSLAIKTGFYRTNGVQSAWVCWSTQISGEFLEGNAEEVKVVPLFEFSLAKVQHVA
jgi:hypothetical protein